MPPPFAYLLTPDAATLGYALLGAAGLFAAYHARRAATTAEAGTVDGPGEDDEDRDEPEYGDPVG